MDRDIKVPLPESKQNECPVSIIGRFPEMDSMVTEILNMQRVKEATGAVPFGVDSGKWPGRWYDAVRVGKIEEDRVEIAKDEARDSNR